MMYYYKSIENSEVVFLLSSSTPNVDSELIEITEEEYENLNKQFFPSYPTSTTEDIIKRLEAKIELQSEQLTFLEDCILEMADEVYA